jgi:thiamine-phosphate pyrophosphorylase
VAEAISGGVDLVQLRVRDERYGPGEVLAMARELRRVTRDRALLFINGHPGIAAQSGADGVHLPEASDTVTRADLPHGLLIGRSVHSPAAAERAKQAGADLLVAGAMFATRSHPGLAPIGPGLIGAIRPLTTVPVIGIGGIDPSNARTVMDAGADGVAVIGAIWGSADARVAARQLREIIDRRPQGQLSPGGPLSAGSIEVTVNGEARLFEGRPSAPELLELLGINPGLVAVAVNGVVVRKADLAATVISDGDVIEIVRAVGGG